MEGGDHGKVCVTGGTGFVASWLIKRLLEDGYSVNTTVREPSNPAEKRDLSFLTNLPRASENLQIFHADLNQPESFTPAIEGCIGVFLVAHPMDMENNESEEVVIKRALDGTLGILRICSKSTTVKRAVYTGSVAAVIYNNNEGTVSSSDTTYKNKSSWPVVDESSWTDVEYARSLGREGLSNYIVSKTLTEKAAIEFAEQVGLDLVTVPAPFIVGPFITPRVPLAVQVQLAMLFRTHSWYEYLTNFKMVHVDDLARAQIYLLETPATKGRYIVSAGGITIHEISDFLTTKYPDLYNKQDDEDYFKELVGGPLTGNLSSKKLLDAGFEFKYGVDDIFNDAIQCCKQKGLLSRNKL